MAVPENDRHVSYMWCCAACVQDTAHEVHEQHQVKRGATNATGAAPIVPAEGPSPFRHSTLDRNGGFLGMCAVAAQRGMNLQAWMAGFSAFARPTPWGWALARPATPR